MQEVGKRTPQAQGLGLTTHHAPGPTLGTIVIEQARHTTPPEFNRAYSRLPLAQCTNPFTKGCVCTYRPPLVGFSGDASPNASVAVTMRMY
eukprot:934569-Pyramimonas_sp.AAC.1